MPFKELQEVIYTDENGDKIETYIQDVDCINNTYKISYNSQFVSEETLIANKEISFSDLSRETDVIIKSYYIEFNFDRLMSILKEEIEDEEVEIVKDMDSITVIFNPLKPEHAKDNKYMDDNLRQILKDINLNLFKRTGASIKIYIQFPYKSPRYVGSIEK